MSACQLAYQGLLGHFASTPSHLRPVLGDTIHELTEAISLINIPADGQELCRRIDALTKPDQWRDKVEPDVFRSLFQWLAGMDHHNVVAFSQLGKSLQNDPRWAAANCINVAFLNCPSIPRRATHLWHCDSDSGDWPALADHAGRCVDRYAGWLHSRTRP